MSIEGQILYLFITAVFGLLMYYSGKTEGKMIGVGMLLSDLLHRKIINIDEDGVITKRGEL
jgi:hypothetical protein